MKIWVSGLVGCGCRLTSVSVLGYIKQPKVKLNALKVELNTDAEVRHSTWGNSPTSHLAQDCATEAHLPRGICRDKGTPFVVRQAVCHGRRERDQRERRRLVLRLDRDEEFVLIAMILISSWKIVSFPYSESPMPPDVRKRGAAACSRRRRDGAVGRDERAVHDRRLLDLDDRLGTMVRSAIRRCQAPAHGALSSAVALDNGRTSDELACHRARVASGEQWIFQRSPSTDGAQSAHAENIARDKPGGRHGPFPASTQQ